MTKTRAKTVLEIGLFILIIFGSFSFMYYFTSGNQLVSGPNPGPTEKLNLESAAFNVTDYSVTVKATLSKSTTDNGDCGLTLVLIKDENGAVVASVTPMPTQLLLNQPTTIKANLGMPLTAGNYRVYLTTDSGGMYYSSFSVSS